jgi:ppGpp synthetase/RelA/SpoT-type nucleotidyltranferase
VRRDGALVEVQLRTTTQQRWAMLVEDGLFEIDRTGAAEEETRRRMQTALFNAQRRLITGDNR